MLAVNQFDQYGLIPVHYHRIESVNFGVVFYILIDFTVKIAANEVTLLTFWKHCMNSERNVQENMKHKKNITSPSFLLCCL